MFSLDQLRCFIAVAENLHFGRAAQQLSMTQPPLSRQIQKLEKQVGTRLLERDNRTVTVTPAGEVFLREARSIIASTEQAGQRARMMGQGKSGQLVIGHTAASGVQILGDVLQRLNHSMPEVAVDLVETVSREQVNMLEAGHLDIGFGRLTEDVEEVTAIPFHRERLVLAAPEDHPLITTSAPLHRADIHGEPLLMHSPVKARYFYDLIVKNFDIDHAAVTYQLSQISTMVSLVGFGHGIALVPESTARRGHAGVAFRPFDDLSTPVAEISLMSRTNNDNPAARRALMMLNTVAPTQSMS
ncbi:MAG TPA: LysR family transcriptional regulator [Candidatus Corynebacterium avicola]|uniref:LysR family transcriptional regulator n=1 Tax=Candidatus Corynebacterium avicola TaxID=2838527 RepID=A0A9D1RNV1_9CORY|nr:LysR family transcriptional regulator [Candidatus Corynebacterium avicola]